MIRLTSTNSNFIATIYGCDAVTGGAVYYKTGKCTFALHNQASGYGKIKWLVNIQPSAVGVQGYGYRAQSNYVGDCVLDLSEPLRAYGACTITITYYVGTSAMDSVEILITPVAGEQPSQVIMPPHPYINIASDMSRYAVYPPVVWYAIPSILDVANQSPLSFELRGILGGDVSGYVPTITGGTLTDHRLVLATNQRSTFNIGLSGVFSYDFTATPIPDCAQICVLQWLSRTGVTKRAVWLVKNMMQAVDGQREMLQQYNGYNVEKGSAIEFDAVIENVGRYDTAYYGDIVTSPLIECWLAREDYATYATSEQRRVMVTEKKLAVPNERETNDLNIHIKYRQYGL